jgi:transcriptional regulator CtsR
MGSYGCIDNLNDIKYELVLVPTEYPIIKLCIDEDDYYEFAFCHDDNDDDSKSSMCLFIQSIVKNNELDGIVAVLFYAVSDDKYYNNTLWYRDGKLYPNYEPLHYGDGLCESYRISNVLQTRYTDWDGAKIQYIKSIDPHLNNKEFKIVDLSEYSVELLANIILRTIGDINLWSSHFTIDLIDVYLYVELFTEEEENILQSVLDSGLIVKSSLFDVGQHELYECIVDYTF